MTNQAPPLQRTVSRRLGAISGRRPGPTVICTAAVHGNEYAGVLAVKRILARLSAAGAPEFHGRIVGLVGNLAALLDPDPDLRYHVIDLNRLGTQECAEEALAEKPEHLLGEMRELAELLAEIEVEVADADGDLIHLDLHTVSSSAPPFVGAIDSPPARKLAEAFDLPVLVGIGRHIEGLLVHLTAKRYGMTSLVIEGGQHDDPRSVDVLEAAVGTVLAARGMVPDAGEGSESVLAACAGENRGRVFEVIHKEPIREPAFRMLPSAVPFLPLTAEVTPVAEANGRTILAAVSGLLFMPNRQRRPRVGDDAYFVVRPLSS